MSAVKPAFEKAHTCCYLCRRWVGHGVTWQTVVNHYPNSDALRKDCSD